MNVQPRGRFSALVLGVIVATGLAFTPAVAAVAAPTPSITSPAPNLAPAVPPVLPASDFTYVNVAGQSANEHGVIDVIAYGPGLNDSLDVNPEPPQCATSENCAVGGSYSCARGADCVVPDNADTRGESGFRFGRDGLSSSAGISNDYPPGGIGTSTQNTVKAASVPGLAEAIQLYIKSRGWNASISSEAVSAAQGFNFQNDDTYTHPNDPRSYQNSAATFDGWVALICAAPPTDPGFCPDGIGEPSPGGGGTHGLLQ